MVKDTAKPERVQCQWCGLEGDIEEFEFDHTHGDGFWCPDCDGHTFFDEAKNRGRRILLLLEQDGAVSFPEQGSETVSAYRFSKRLSPFRYPGAKSRIINLIAGQMQEEHKDTFVEVFAGGASVGLALLDAGFVNRLILNDTDDGVYSFWFTVLHSPESLINRIRGITPTAATFQSCQFQLQNPKGVSMAELAWSQLVCNRLSFSGIVKAGILGGKNGGHDANLARWNPEELVRRIEHIYGMRDRIFVTQIDAVHLIEQSAYWEPNTTLFVDPPYVKAGKQLYLRYFEEEDHLQLAWMISSLYQGMPGADIIITYDDCPLIRNAYPWADVRVIPRSRIFGSRSVDTPRL